MLKNVPKYLGRDDAEAMAWLADESNLQDLTEFLASYDLDINDVREIWFYGLYFRVEVYERDDEGNHVLEVIEEDENGTRMDVKMSTQKIPY